MRFVRRRDITLGAACALALGHLAPIVRADPYFSILDLGTLGGVTSKAFDINNSGQVAGFSKTLLGADRAIRTAPNSPISLSDDLGTLPGGNRSYAYSINAAGVVVGDAYTTNNLNGDRAYRYNSSMQSLGTIDGSWSYAFGINNSNQIVGSSSIANGLNSPTHAYLYSGAQMHDLGALGDEDLNSAAAAINSGGYVVGYTQYDPVNYWIERAFVWTPTSPNATTGTMTDIGTLGGGYSYAWSINDNNEIVGAANTAGDAEYHAFKHSGSSMVDLGTLGGTYSEAWDINLGSDVVGQSTDSSGSTRPFLHTGGTMYDLNNLIPVGSGWTLQSARAINDLGQIVGWGLNPLGQVHGFVLTPMSVESTWNVDASGLWSDVNNWVGGVPGGVDITARFAGAITSPQTVTADAPVTLGRIDFENANAYTIAGPGPITMDVNLGVASVNVISGSHTIAAPLILNDATRFDVAGADSVLTVSAPVTATATGVSVIKDGAGVLAVPHVRVEGLNVEAGRVTTTGAGDDGTSRLSSVSVAGQLDLRDDKLIVVGGDIGSWDGSAYTGLTGLLQSGRGDGSWNGNGIITSMPEAAEFRTTLAIATADELGLVGQTFGGLPVESGDVLIKYTWGGDADLNGQLNGDDYFFIDSNVTNQLSGYHNGDFDYNGVVDGDDYFFIDANMIYAQANGIIIDFLPASGVSAVPEPAALSLAIGLLLSLRRRRATD